MPERVRYADIQTPRREVLEDKGLLDMVNLAAIAAKPGRRQRGLESHLPAQEILRDPVAFFELTYPTEDVRQTLTAVARRASSPGDVPGTILLSGRYGLGKSHILLAVHHALSSPEVAARWASRWGVGDLSFPSDAIVVTRSFIERTAENLWDVFFESVGAVDIGKMVTSYPDGEMIESTLGDRPVFLVFDELERWFDALPDEKRQSRNRNFIQALTEVSMRDPRLTLVTSVLGEREEPAETIRRTKPLELSFRSSDDRQKVILYRLFANHGDHDTELVDGVVDAYIDAYRTAGLNDLDAYREKMRASFPFTPEFIEILTQKIPRLGGFQNTRGTLRFLAKVVRATHEDSTLISSRDIPIHDASTSNDLSLLDSTSGGTVVGRALGDNYDAVPAKTPFKDALFSTILFYSVADPSRPGATLDEVLFAVLGPDQNPNALRDALRQIQSFAFNLHSEGDRYVFKAQENPQARINAVALSPQITEEACQARIADTIRQEWGAPRQTAVFTGDVIDLQRQLREIGNRRPKYILSTLSLADQHDRRLEIQNLDERRNLVLLIEPRVRQGERSGGFSALRDTTLLSCARRIEACSRLLDGKPARDAAKVYDEVRRHEQNRLVQGIEERFGTYIAWEQTGSTGSKVTDSWFETNELTKFSAAAFLEDLKKDHANLPAVVARIRAMWEDYRHRRVSLLIDHFERTPGEPIPYEETLVPAAIRQLARSGVLGLEDEQGRRYGKRAGDISEADLPKCSLVDPPQEVTEPAAVLPQHVRVAVTYDREVRAVRLSWQYPEGGPYRTLVQRYRNAKGWQTGQVYNVDPNRTHDANRYFGTDKECVDDQGIQSGAWFVYYVFLVEDVGGTEIRAILSKSYDVKVPPDEETTEPGLIRIPLQPTRPMLIMEIEKAVTRKGVMSSDSRVRTLEFTLHGITEHTSLISLTGDLGLPAEQVERKANVTLTVRGEFKRMEAMQLAHKLPDLPGTLYGALLKLKDEEQ
jgi:hypothetical protein